MNRLNKSSVAFIVGNGASRHNTIDVTRLRDRGAVYGCNALYRDYDEEYINKIVTVDHKITDEILASDFPKSKLIAANTTELLEPYNLHRSFARPRNNAGMLAMQKALEHGYRNIILIGFDFLLVDEAMAVSNIYDGSACYDNKTRATLDDSRRRLLYFEYMLKQNPFANFYAAFPDNQKVFNVNSVKNFGFLSYQKIFNINFE